MNHDLKEIWSELLVPLLICLAMAAMAILLSLAVVVVGWAAAEWIITDHPPWCPQKDPGPEAGVALGAGEVYRAGVESAEKEPTTPFPSQQLDVGVISVTQRQLGRACVPTRVWGEPWTDPKQGPRRWAAAALNRGQVGGNPNCSAQFSLNRLTSGGRGGSLQQDQRQQRSTTAGG